MKWYDFDEIPPDWKSENDFKDEGFTIEAKVLICGEDPNTMVILHPNGQAYRLRVD